MKKRAHYEFNIQKAKQAPPLVKILIFTGLFVFFTIGIWFPHLMVWWLNGQSAHFIVGVLVVCLVAVVIFGILYALYALARVFLWSQREEGK